jgi:hypothetical protein
MSYKIEILLNDAEQELLLEEGAETGVDLGTMIKRYAIEYTKLRREHELMAPLIHGQLATMEMALASTLSRIAEQVDRIVAAIEEDAS